MDNLNPTKISEMSYTDFIAMIQETNRCPGGKETIRKVIQNTFLNPSSNVLEIGTNTGFTALEIARTIRCTVTGVDISEPCIQQAKRLLRSDIPEIQGLVNFMKASAYELPFSGNTFDLVVAGGATSFMNEKNKAIDEYLRVLKPWGFLSATQLFYRKSPPQKVLDAVSGVLGVKIKPLDEKDWLDIFINSTHVPELYYFNSYSLDTQDDATIDSYISYFENKPHLQALDEGVRITIRNKWREYIEIFNENHKYLGYFIAIFRKRYIEEEPELFVRR